MINRELRSRTDRWRLIEQAAPDGTAAKVELYDYESDPQEAKDHAEAHPEVVRELQALLAQRPVIRPRPANAE